MMTFIAAEFKRSVGAPIGHVNRVIQDALRGAGFEISNGSLTVIEARRGSKVAMAMLGGFALKKIPMVTSVQLEPHGHGCYLAVKLADDWNVLYGPASAVAKRYHEVFGDVRQAVDGALRQLTPAVRVDGSYVRSKKRHSRVMADLAEGMEKAGDRAQDMLAGDWSKAKRPWDDVERVRFESSAGTASLTIIDVQAMLDTGTLITTHRDSLPPNLLNDVERLETLVEQALCGRTGVAIVTLRDADVPALEFLHQQASLRNRLRTRTLQICADCHAPKLTNPDYQKILARNQALRNIGGGIGAAISKGRITPYVLFGRVMSFARLNPSFVCPRCQGMSADELIVALCGECGEVQRQTVLTTCAKCTYDLRKSLPRVRLWSDREDGITRPPLGTAASWLPDPAGRHELRYWNGQDWTAHVADDGQATTDALKDLPGAGSLVRCERCGQRNHVPAAAAGTPHCGTCHQPLPRVTDAETVPA